MRIRLGSRVRDTVTGFEGVAVARTEWVHGCARYGVEATELHDGKPIEAQWFDEQRLSLVAGASSVRADDLAGAAPGGPRPDPAPRGPGG